MKLQIFSVYDSKAAVYCAPFFCPTMAVAQRAFARTAADPETQMYAFPQDFTLFHLGEFDDEKGTFLMWAQQVNLGLAAQFQGVNHVRVNASQQVSHDAQVQRGAKGGNSEVDV